jgi:quinol monooxygenase YgiN
LILITGTVEVAPEDRAAFVAAASRHCGLSRQEPGCISHTCSEDVERPNTFTFVERWRDMDAVKEHFAKDYSHATVAMIRKLAKASTGVEIHDIASTRVV